MIMVHFSSVIFFSFSFHSQTVAVTVDDSNNNNRLNIVVASEGVRVSLHRRMIQASHTTCFDLC
jgi:hypothetical protein